MRSIVITIAVAGAALILAGCVPSLHPLYTEESTVFKDSLLGTWISDSGAKCKFTESGKTNYELLYVDEAPVRFEARLIELGGVTFLDLYQQENEYSLVRAHLIARVTIGKDSISIALLNYDWLRKLSDQNKLNLAHERLTDGTLVLTASTRELQAFILSNANNKEAFGDTEVFHSLTPGR